jgi:hypothetical protein
MPYPALALTTRREVQLVMHKNNSEQYTSVFQERFHCELHTRNMCTASLEQLFCLCPSLTPQRWMEAWHSPNDPTGYAKWKVQRSLTFTYSDKSTNFNTHSAQRPPNFCDWNYCYKHTPLTEIVTFRKTWVLPTCAANNVSNSFVLLTCKSEVGIRVCSIRSWSGSWNMAKIIEFHFNLVILIHVF